MAKAWDDIAPTPPGSDAKNRAALREQEVRIRLGGSGPEKVVRPPADGILLESGDWSDYFEFYKSYAKQMLKRCISKDIGLIQLTNHELAVLVHDDYAFGKRAAQYAAWRATLLHVGVIFFGLLVAADVMLLSDPWEAQGENSLIIQRIHPRYRDYFTDLVWYNWVLQAGMTFGSFLSVITAFWAAWQWTHWNISAICVRCSFVFGFAPPFFLLLVLPFRHSVDFEAIQQQACHDVLNVSTSIIPGEDALWPAKAGHIAMKMFNEYGISMPNDFCERDPTTWGLAIAAELSNSGLLEDNGSCPYADGMASRLMLGAASSGSNIAVVADRAVNEQAAAAGQARADTVAAAESSRQQANSVASSVGGAAADPAVAVSNSAAAYVASGFSEVDSALLAIQDSGRTGADATGCPYACHDCATTCLPYLAHMSSMAMIYGVGALSRDTLDGASANCMHCFGRNAGLTCPQLCSTVMVAMTKQAFSGQIQSRFMTCITPDKMDDFLLLASLATQTGYWKMALGSVYAMLSMGSLLPLSLTLMFGAAKGSQIAKSVIPQSRLPGVISSSAASFTFPFIFQMVVLVQQIFGSNFTLIAVLCLLVGVIIMMKPGVFVSEMEEENRKRMKTFDRVTKVCMAIAVLIFIIELATSDIVRGFGELLSKQGIELSNDDYAQLSGRAAWVTVQTCATLLGKSLISTVFFGDGVLSLMHHFHYGEIMDSDVVQEKRFTLVQDIHTLWADPVKFGWGVFQIVPDVFGAGESEKPGVASP